jgi:hypothetical protein
MEPARLAVAFDAVLKRAGRSSRNAIGSAAPILLRLVPIALFLWYLVEFVVHLFARGEGYFGILLAAPALVLLVLFAIKTKAEYPNIPKDSPPASSARPYFYAVLLPVLAVLISTIWNAQYTTPLLRFTQRIFEVLSP